MSLDKCFFFQHPRSSARSGNVQARPKLLRERGQRHHARTHHHARVGAQVSTILHLVQPETIY